MAEPPEASPTRFRLDQRLVDLGLFESRARAQAAVRAGLVRVDGAAALKPASTVGPSSSISVNGDVHPYVSRGGVKLDAGLRAFDIAAAGAICLDLGASTGGFTDALLRAGASRVYAVDVGTGQLHRRLRSDPRVVNLERTHARDLRPSLVSEPIDLLVADLSFISLKKALSPALSLVRGGGRLCALIKPQFEVGPENIGKGGIVAPTRANTLGVAEDLTQWVGDQAGWAALGFIESPISVGDGNREFLRGAIKSG